MTAVAPPVLGKELSSPPTDGITNLRFSNHSDHLLVSSWDKCLTEIMQLIDLIPCNRPEFLRVMVYSSAYSGVCDCLFDHWFWLVFNYGKEDVLGKHEAHVRCVEYSYATGLYPSFAVPGSRAASDILCVLLWFLAQHTRFLLRVELSGVMICQQLVTLLRVQDRFLSEWDSGHCFLLDDVIISNRKLIEDEILISLGMVMSIVSARAWQLISGSWDKTIKCWDPRGASGQERTLVGTYAQPERVYSMSLVGHRLVVATAGRHVNVYDLRNMSQPEQRRESSLKYQTRCVRCYPNGTGYALSSVEGRVAMEFFDLSDAGQSKKYAFKCHRKSEAGRDIVYPVNAIAFHPIYGTFATGGCDGIVNVWDGNNKKRLYQYVKYPSSISALSFSRDGRLLAVASSYTYEEGEKPHEPDSIFIRSVNEVEVKPKPKVYANPPA
uniref:Mitotic checkpoint protein BUB3.1 n=1 Tax=Chenopodium quinoa TaxID=63459 RepID=A0A803NAH2_CHEQI